MISLNQASDLYAALRDPEFRRSLQEFVTVQRMHLVQAAMDNIRGNLMDEARKYAAQDEAYSDLIANLESFAERAITRG